MAHSLLAVVSALLVSLVSSQSPGISASISTGGLNYIVGASIPALEQLLDNLSIPGISGSQDGFDYQLQDISCNSFLIGATDVSTAPTTGIALAMTGVSLSCSANWNFKLSIWPHVPDGSGSADISTSGTSGDVSLLVVSDATENPQVTVTGAQLNVGSINVDFHGSAWDWLLNIFKSFIEDAVSKAIVNEFGTAINTLVDKTINPELANLQMTLPLHLSAPYNVSEVRFGLTSDPTFTTDFIGIALRGDIVPIANPNIPMPVTPPALPPWNEDAAESFLQVQLSSFTLATAIYTFYQANLTNWLFPSTEIPLGLNSTLAYVLIAPGLPLAYPNCYISLDVAIQSLPNITFTPSGINLTAPISVSWLVTTSNGTVVEAFSLLAVASLDGSVTIGPDSEGVLALMGDIAYLDAQLSVLNSNVGPVSTSLLQVLINTLFEDLVVPTINTIFGNGFPLPEVSGLTITGATVQYNTGYLSLLANFTFTPPEEVEGGLTAGSAAVAMMPVGEEVAAVTPVSAASAQKMAIQKALADGLSQVVSRPSSFRGKL